MPLGVLPYDEMYYEDMIKALEHIQHYAPSKEVERELMVPSQTGLETVKLKEKKFSTTIVGGDQLTVSRIRGSQRIRGNSDTSEQRLDGLLPVSEDWHAKMCFMEVRLTFIRVSVCMSDTLISLSGDMETTLQNQVWNGTWNIVSITEFDKSTKHWKEG